MGQFLGVLSTIVSIVAGVFLLDTKAANENSLIEVLIHGIGIYFIAKGLFMGPSLIVQAKTEEAINKLVETATNEKTKAQQQAKDSVLVGQAEIPNNPSITQ